MFCFDFSEETTITVCGQEETQSLTNFFTLNCLQFLVSRGYLERERSFLETISESKVSKVVIQEKSGNIDSTGKKELASLISAMKACSSFSEADGLFLRLQNLLDKYHSLPHFIADNAIGLDLLGTLLTQEQLYNSLVFARKWNFSTSLFSAWNAMLGYVLKVGKEYERKPCLKSKAEYEKFEKISLLYYYYVKHQCGDLVPFTQVLRDAVHCKIDDSWMRDASGRTSAHLDPNSCQDLKAHLPDCDINGVSVEELMQKSKSAQAGRRKSGREVEKTSWQRLVEIFSPKRGVKSVSEERSARGGKKGEVASVKSPKKKPKQSSPLLEKGRGSGENDDDFGDDGEYNVSSSKKRSRFDR